MVYFTVLVAYLVDIREPLEAQGFKFPENATLGSVRRCKVELPQGWTTLQILQNAGTFYFLDAEMRPQYLLQIIDGFILRKVDTFTEEYPVTLPLPDFYWKDEEGNYSYDEDSPLVNFYDKCLEVLTENNSTETLVQYADLYEISKSSRIQEMMNLEMELLSKKHQLFLEKALSLGMDAYLEFDPLLRDLRGSVEEYLYRSFERACVLHDKIREVPPKERHLAGPSLTATKGYSLLKEMSAQRYVNELDILLRRGATCIVPYYEALGTKPGELPSEKVYRLSSPYKCEDLEERIRLKKLISEEPFARYSHYQ